MLSVFDESVTFDSVLSLERYSSSITLRHHVAATTKHWFLTGNDAFFAWFFTVCPTHSGPM